MNPVRPFGEYFDNPDWLFNWLNGAVFGTAVMNAVIRAGICETLFAEPMKLPDLAARHDLPAGTLGRLVDFLLAHGMLDRDPDGTLHANSRTEAMHDAAGYLANTETSAFAGSQLLPALRQGRPPFEVHFGAPVFDHFGQNPARAEMFGRFMGFMTRRVTRFLFAQHRFAPFETVCDIGGSMGDLLLAILGEYPGTRGVLFDLPEVVEMARPGIAASPFADRVDFVGGSFFEGVPAADLYTLKQILHDWDDSECVQILASIRASMPAKSRLVVIDHILSAEPEPNEALGTDVAMLVWANGRERKLAELEAVFAESGFEIARVSRNPTGHSAIEVIPA